MGILRHPPFFRSPLDERNSPCMSEKMRHSPSQLTDSEIFGSQSIAAQNAAGLGGVVSTINQSFAELQVIAASWGNSLVATSNGLVPGFWDLLQILLTFCHLFHHLFNFPRFQNAELVEITSRAPHFSWAWCLPDGTAEVRLASRRGTRGTQNRANCFRVEPKIWFLSTWRSMRLKSANGWRKRSVATNCGMAFGQSSFLATAHTGSFFISINKHELPSIKIIFLPPNQHQQLLIDIHKKLPSYPMTIN